MFRLLVLCFASVAFDVAADQQIPLLDLPRELVMDVNKRLSRSTAVDFMVLVIS